MRWNSRTDLIEAMLARAHSGKQVVLSVDTAIRVALDLRRVGHTPRREDIMKVFCESKCSADRYGDCMKCMSKANEILILIDNEPRR